MIFNDMYIYIYRCRYRYRYLGCYLTYVFACFCIIPLVRLITQPQTCLGQLRGRRSGSAGSSGGAGARGSRDAWGESVFGRRASVAGTCWDWSRIDRVKSCEIRHQWDTGITVRQKKNIFFTGNLELQLISKRWQFSRVTWKNVGCCWEPSWTLSWTLAAGWWWTILSTG